MSMAQLGSLVLLVPRFIVITPAYNMRALHVYKLTCFSFFVLISVNVLCYIVIRKKRLICVNIVAIQYTHWEGKPWVG